MRGPQEDVKMRTYEEVKSCGAMKVCKARNVSLGVKTELYERLVVHYGAETCRMRNFYYYQWHIFLLPIHHPVIRLDYYRRGAFRLIFFYCCNYLG